MEPSKVKTSTVFHEEYYQLDIATGYGFQKMVNTRFRTCQKRRKGSFRYLFRFICLLENWSLTNGSNLKLFFYLPDWLRSLPIKSRRSQSERDRNEIALHEHGRRIKTSFLRLWHLHPKGSSTTCSLVNGVLDSIHVFGSIVQVLHLSSHPIWKY